MKNIKMGPKLIASYLLITIMAVATCIFLLRELSYINDGTTDLYENAVLPIINLLNTERIGQELRIEMRNALRARSTEEFSKIIANKDSLLRAMHAVYNTEEKRLINVDAKVVIDNVRKAIDEFSPMFNQYIKDIAGTKYEEREIPVALTAKRMEISKLDGQFTSFKEKASSEINEKGNRTYKSATTISTIILVIMVALSISIGLFMTFSITGPLAKVVEMLKKGEDGDMRARADVTSKTRLE